MTVWQIIVIITIVIVITSTIILSSMWITQLGEANKQVTYNMSLTSRNESTWLGMVQYESDYITAWTQPVY